MNQFAEWNSSYVIVGSAAGALIGLQFVVMTLIAEKPVRDMQRAGAAFATPTIVHFSAVLLVSALMRVPWPGALFAAIVLAYAPARPDTHRDVRTRPGAAVGRPSRGNPARRCCLLRAKEKHWHGASPNVAMTHIANQEALDGKVVDWMEKVSDEQYDGKGK